VVAVTVGFEPIASPRERVPVTSISLINEEREPAVSLDLTSAHSDSCTKMHHQTVCADPTSGHDSGPAKYGDSAATAGRWNDRATQRATRTGGRIGLWRVLVPDQHAGAWARDRRDVFTQYLVSPIG
jgi:hypothetical protein